MRNLEFTFRQLLAEARRRRCTKHWELVAMYEDMLLDKEIDNNPLARFIDLCKVSFSTKITTNNFDRFGNNETDINVRYELSDKAREVLNEMNLVGFANEVRATVLNSGHISSKQLDIIFK